MLVALVDTLKQLRYQIAHLEDDTLQSEYPELASFIQQVGLTVAESKQELVFLYQFLYVYGRKSEAPITVSVTNSSAFIYGLG